MRHNNWKINKKINKNKSLHKIRYDNTTFFVANEVIEDSHIEQNADIMSIIWGVVVPTIQKDEVAKTFFDTKKDLAIVLAHGYSTKEEFNIFLERQDRVWIEVNRFIEDFIKQTNVILFCCNKSWYKIWNTWKNIVYPTWVTRYLGTSFVGNCI